MDKSHRVHFPVETEHYEALGALTAHYSLAELYTSMLVWHLLKLPPYNGTLVTGNLSLKQRLMLAIELAENDGTDTKNFREIERAFGKENGLTAKRNRMIHAVWAINADRTILSPMTFNRAGKLTFHEHTTAGVIEEITKELVTYAKKLRAEMEAIGISFTETISFQAPKRASPDKRA